MTDSSTPISIFWFRRDLRLHDNAGLFHALRSGQPVQPIFIFDRNILDKLENQDDRRVNFIHRHLQKMQEQLTDMGSTLWVFYGNPQDIWNDLVRKNNITGVFTNHDYEPYARQRDEQLHDFFASKEIPFHTFKDQVIFEKSEVVKDDGTPYTVYTPYMRKWRSRLESKDLASYDCESLFSSFRRSAPRDIPSLKSMGFHTLSFDEPGLTPAESLIRHYGDTRDIPGIQGTSRLSVHLRFGTVSVRELTRLTFPWSDKYVNELIWREFYQMILWHFPHVSKRAFKPQYDQLVWLNNESDFKKWCEGNTGYPIVDAGMRELLATGHMHNRVRMITASFLTKFLLIDWRWGEAWFARHLLDFELASNNGGWQWSAGTGVDAAPYFRIFNMDEQTKKFDPDFSYIRKWVPEFQELTYPQRMVDYKMARERCLHFYKSALSADTTNS